MTAATTPSHGPVPRHALRRGTRGFAAIVLLLTAMAVLAVALFVLPASAIDRGALTVLIPLGTVFGVAHLVAAFGALRRRAWVVSLSLYLLAIGLGVATFATLLVVTGLDPFAPAGAVPTEHSRLETLGLLAWLAGSWIVAARFLVRGMAAPVVRAVEGPDGLAVVEHADRPEPVGRRSFAPGGASS